MNKINIYLIFQVPSMIPRLQAKDYMSLVPCLYQRQEYTIDPKMTADNMVRDILKKITSPKSHLSYDYNNLLLLWPCEGIIKSKEKPYKPLGQMYCNLKGYKKIISSHLVEDLMKDSSTLSKAKKATDLIADCGYDSSEVSFSEQTLIPLS